MRQTEVTQVLEAPAKDDGWGKKEMISVVFTLLHAMVWMALWFVRTLAIAAGLFIVVLIIIAIYSWMRGDDENEER